jgi:hypothetical protein
MLKVEKADDFHALETLTNCAATRERCNDQEEIAEKIKSCDRKEDSAIKHQSSDKDNKPTILSKKFLNTYLAKILNMIIFPKNFRGKEQGQKFQGYVSKVLNHIKSKNFPATYNKFVTLFNKVAPLFSNEKKQIKTRKRIEGTREFILPNSIVALMEQIDLQVMLKQKPNTNFFAVQLNNDAKDTSTVTKITTPQSP